LKNSTRRLGSTRLGAPAKNVCCLKWACYLSARNSEALASDLHSDVSCSDLPGGKKKMAKKLKKAKKLAKTMPLQGHGPLK
jgi:hypothetical protein